MKKFCLIVACVICGIVYGYGQTTFADKIAILKAEDKGKVLDPSGEIMLQSSMLKAFSELQNVSIIDLSGYSSNEGVIKIREIGKKVSADMVIIPSVVKINDYEMFLSARMMNVETGIMDAGANVKCNMREKGKKQSDIFKQSCEELARNLSKQIVATQMEKIKFERGELYRDGRLLSESEIKNLLAERYGNWKYIKESLDKGQRCMIAGSVLTTLGFAMTAVGTCGIIATKGWGMEEPYRWPSLVGVVVGSASTFTGLMCFIGSKSKKAAWKEMEDIFLEKSGKSDYWSGLYFGTQQYGVGFTFKF